MTPISIVHLVEERMPCDLQRSICHLRCAPQLAARTRQSVRVVRRGTLSIGRIDADIIVSHLGLGWRRLPALLGLRTMNPSARLIHVEHLFSESYVAHRVTPLRRVRSLLRTAYALFDRVVAVSETQGDWMRRNHLVASERLNVIPSAVPLDKFRALTPTTATPRVIGAIGPLEKRKGFDTLIQAFQGLQGAELRLEIYGEGPEWDRLSQLAATDTRVTLRGISSDPTRTMSRVDAVAMPSRWEPESLVATEARAARRPLLVAPVDGLIDHIAHGARVVQDNTVAGWTNALRELVSTPQPEMVQQGLPDPEMRFVQDWLALLQEHPDKKGPRAQVLAAE